MSGHRLEDLLAAMSADERDRLSRRWNGRAATARELAAVMQDRERLSRAWSELGGGARAVLGCLLRRDDHCLPMERLVAGVPSSGRTEAEVTREIDGLEEVGLVFRVDAAGNDVPVVALAREVAPVLRGLERSDAGGNADAGRPGPFTLKGFLDERHFKGGDNGTRDDARTARHARQAYKLFLMPAAVKKRIRRLPDDVREVVDLAMTRFGGLLPRSLHLKTRGEEGAFARDDLGKTLEESLIGRVGDLDLRALGIELAEETLCTFQEVCLVYLRGRAHDNGVTPPSERVAGVDLATNVMRFLRYVDENSVRYTVRGEIFKATKKKMMTQLVVAEPEDAENVFRFIYRFAVARRLVQRTGERTLRLSDAGRAFEDKELPEKLKDLLAFAIEDPHLGGDPFHQVKLRRILLRLLRRLDPEAWYDAMYVPFLARNSYLTQLEGSGARTYYTARREQGHYAPLEDLQKLAWNLFHWVRQRLHLLGIVDLGFDGGGHPTALRLSRLGASLLAGVPAQAAEGARSTLVVNPDFEILLFPEADAFELVHTIDRFSKRTASDRLFRFQLSEESVRSALADGMGIGEILEVLTDRCRTPLPQNVLFSLTDWGDRAGAVTMDEHRVLRARKPEILDRLLEHPRIRELTKAADGVAIRDDVNVADFRALLRDLGFHLELRQDDNGARDAPA